MRSSTHQFNKSMLLGCHSSTGVAIVTFSTHFPRFEVTSIKTSYRQALGRVGELLVAQRS